MQSNGGGNEADIDTPSDSLEPGAIVGIVFGLLVILGLGVTIAVVVVLYLVRQRKTVGKYLTESDDIGLGKNPHKIAQALYHVCTSWQYLQYLLYRQYLNNYDIDWPFWGKIMYKQISITMQIT